MTEEDWYYLHIEQAEAAQATILAQAERLVALERLTASWCDQPEDRMWHAEDGTWWARKGDRLVSAEAPPELRCVGSTWRCAIRHHLHWNCRECGTIGPYIGVDEEGCCLKCKTAAVPINGAGECDLCGAGIESGDGHNEGCDYDRTS